MPTGTQHSDSNERQQMDAVVIKASGPPAQSLAYRCEPVAEPGQGEVLVEVHAAAAGALENRLRLVLATGEEVDRLTGLGTRPLNETRLPAVRWTTFADPEGNDFDLVTWQPV